MKYRLSLDVVLQFLHEQQSLAAEELRRTKGNEDTLERKKQFDRAIECLKICERYQIHPDAQITTLPWPRDAFGEFLVVDVNEMEAESKSSWSAIKMGGEMVTLQAGDIVIKQGHPFNLPPDEPNDLG
jgi:ERCC4-type nuclease